MRENLALNGNMSCSETVPITCFRILSTAREGGNIDTSQRGQVYFCYVYAMRRCLSTHRLARLPQTTGPIASIVCSRTRRFLGLAAHSTLRDNGRGGTCANAFSIPKRETSSPSGSGVFCANSQVTPITLSHVNLVRLGRILRGGEGRGGERGVFHPMSK